MDFSIPDEYQQLRSGFEAFLQREVAPVEERFRPQIQEGEYTPEMRAAAQGLRKKSAEVGYYAAYMPEEVGGWGVSTLGYTLLVETLGASGYRLGSFVLGPPNPDAPTKMLLDLSPELRDRYLKPLIAADATMCF